MKYNHAFDIAFVVISDDPEGNCTDDELFAGLEKRIAELRRNPGEVQEACGAPFDSYELEEAE